MSLTRNEIVEKFLLEESNSCYLFFFDDNEWIIVNNKGE